MIERKRLMPEFRIKRRIIEKENELPEHSSYRQLVLKSQRMSHAKGTHATLNPRRFRSNTKDTHKDSRVINNSQTIHLDALKPLSSNYTSIPSILSSLNHKLTQQQNIPLWSRVAKQLQSETPRDKQLRTLYRNLDSKINGESCCFKISKRRTSSQTIYTIVVMKLNKKIHATFRKQEWEKITRVYPTYSEIEEHVSLSCDNKIILPIDLDSDTISEHLRRSTSQNLHSLRMEP